MYQSQNRKGCEAAPLFLSDLYAGYSGVQFVHLKIMYSTQTPRQTYTYPKIPSFTEVSHVYFRYWFSLLAAILAAILDAEELNVIHVLLS